MDESRSLSADLLAWLRSALPWLFWGGAGGFLAAPFVDRKPTILVFAYSLARSSIVGLAAGLFLAGRGYEAGDITLAVLTAGVIADLVIHKARRWAGQALERLFARLAVRRGGGEGGRTGGDR